MGESNLHVLTKFTKNDPNFGKNFIIWKKSKSQIDLAIRDINREYSKLIREKTKKINYNYYTDDIIAQYLPYKTKDKKEKLNLSPIFMIRNRKDSKSRKTTDIEDFEKLIDLSPVNDDFSSLDEISSFLFFDSN